MAFLAEAHISRAVEGEPDERADVQAPAVVQPMADHRPGQRRHRQEKRRHVPACGVDKNNDRGHDREIHGEEDAAQARRCDHRSVSRGR